MKVRCGAFSKRPSEAKGVDSGTGATEASELRGSACALTADVAATKAAEDPATRNSLRVDLFKMDIEPPKQACQYKCRALRSLTASR
jgi:hypothetical protein